MPKAPRTHRVFLIGEITEESVADLLKQLYEIDDNHPNDAIELIINSQGGSIIEGLALYSTLVELSERGNGKHFLTTKVRGMAGSMATIILQAGDWRVSGAVDVTIWHEARMSFESSPISEIHKDLQVWSAHEAMLNKIVQDRSGLNDDEIAMLHGPDDTVLLAKAALLYNLIDEIA